MFHLLIHKFFVMLFPFFILVIKIGPALASDKKFVEKLKSVVYSDHLTPAEFEQQWNDVIVEYKLESNPWLSEMFNIRSQ